MSLQSVQSSAPCSAGDNRLGGTVCTTCHSRWCRVCLSTTGHECPRCAPRTRGWLERERLLSVYGANPSKLDPEVHAGELLTQFGGVVKDALGKAEHMAQRPGTRPGDFWPKVRDLLAGCLDPPESPIS